MDSGKRSLLSPILDLITINKEQYYVITSAVEALLILVLIIFAIDPFDLPLALIDDGEGSSVSFTMFKIHEHTIHPPGYERDCRILFGVLLAGIYTTASVPLVDDAIQPLAHVIFMTGSFIVALCLVVFAYLSKSPQSHSVSSSCTLSWYVLVASTVLMSANRLFHFMAVRSVVLAKKDG